jgi:hypothetical protein
MLAKRAIMAAKTDFWLYVHELNLCLDAEGDTSVERRENILIALCAMPPLARTAVVAELRHLLQEMTILDQAAEPA